MLTGCGSGSDTRVINLYNAPQQNLQSIVDRCNQKADGKYKIVLNTLPRDADGQREQMVRRLAAEDSGMDVLGIDVTWTAELASANWIRPWTGERRQEASKGVIDAPLETAMFDDKMYAAPSNTNVQLLWYRDDLLGDKLLKKVDNGQSLTWKDLIGRAEELKKTGSPQYVEATGAQYEGLVVLFNSMLAGANGKMLNAAGDKVELGAPGVKALQTLKDFATSAAADPSLSNSQEGEVQHGVESGAAFAEVNWPFVYAAMQATTAKVDDKGKVTDNGGSNMKDHFKWTTPPGIDGTGHTTLGGSNFAVSKYSEHPDEAFDAALCLRDPQSQRISAIRDGLPPTIESVYHGTQKVLVDSNGSGKLGDTIKVKGKDVPDTKVGMKDAYPMADDILKALKDAVLRPKTPIYQNVSTVTSYLLSPPSSIDPKATEQQLKDQLTSALKSEGVLP
ncbi:MAG TPA: extracellular solute-binding protein [Stackebrandtia sp.]|jgi:multiple sugar transport system substrate-binding protein|uniref:extracellular solute-binding protein n=1 Tax=Stackebrandtia sp. TaxID=2023065 RepID=UPI002D594932|nr:extracellular solute-binding protein [Stackebrandtia sp.]HZE42073.1 extracellular solute-binding protein [Stackebrandtia sp.]